MTNEILEGGCSLFSDIGFLGAPVDKNGSFGIFKLLKTLIKNPVWFIIISEIIVFLVFEK